MSKKKTKPPKRAKKQKAASSVKPDPNRPPVVLRCVGGPDGCHQAVDWPSSIGYEHLALYLFQAHGWLMSVVSPVATMVDGLPTRTFSLAPMCQSCAQRVHPPEVITAAKARLGTPDVWVVPATTYGELEVTRKMGRGIVAGIEKMLGEPGSYASSVDELYGAFDGMCYALCGVRPTLDVADAPWRDDSVKHATLLDAAAACREVLPRLVKWIDDNEAAAWKRISS